MEINLLIGQNISRIRREKGLSQEKLAGEAGIDRTYMTSIEKGKRSISVAVALKIANALNVSIMELISNHE
ncbi:MAG: helix-turn-helix transcriptional regulator [Bacteroidetes bacterium]|nr:helix-turn-helix transcriptional regulator [Bacteroidota bacterium]